MPEVEESTRPADPVTTATIPLFAFRPAGFTYGLLPHVPMPLSTTFEDENADAEPNAPWTSMDRS